MLLALLDSSAAAGEISVVLSSAPATPARARVLLRRLTIVRACMGPPDAGLAHANPLHPSSRRGARRTSSVLCRDLCIWRRRSVCRQRQASRHERWCSQVAALPETQEGPPSAMLGGPW